MREELLKIINHYGVLKQLKYIHSEYFELDEAIIRAEYPAIAKDKKPEELKEMERKHIAEEIADIMVMLEQFRLHYGISLDEIENIMKYKVKRQLERIDKE